jgi:hypothetical protein
MKRLFTFGCSYTWFMWPTWADLLSVEYDYFENWGLVGLGNRAIAERIAECHAKHKFTKDDTIVVQWSTTLRHDWHSDRPIVTLAGWQTSGNAFSETNIKFYKDDWYSKFFSEKSWTMHTLNSIFLTQGLLDSIGCNWRMTAIGDIRKLGADIDKDVWNYERIAITPEELLASHVLWKRYPEFLQYKVIWEKYEDNWLPAIMPTASKNDNLYWYFQAEYDKQPWKEGHPTTPQHSIWLNKYLRPSLGLPKIAPNTQTNLVDEALSIKHRPEHMDCLKFEKFLLDKNSNIFKPLSWPNSRLGF